ncbi:MAG: SUMF1/EgtB/PvdO family nonheme iron enzyme, partial [Thermoguttaceae bacterium]|nr:SUMF1/EgtB/PvdO family nonheme iron enzyme [Thermoguttaceae bacterium]
ESFFAPVDVDVKNLFESSVSINKMLDDLKESDASFRWMLVDACRDDPLNPADDSGAPAIKDAAKSFGARALGEIANVPESVALLQSCQPGKRSYEGGGPGATKIKNGFFTLSLLEALDENDPKADANRDGVLSFLEAAEYVSERTNELATTCYGEAQTPNLSGSITNFALLDGLSVPPPPPPPKTWLPLALLTLTGVAAGGAYWAGRRQGRPATLATSNGATLASGPAVATQSSVATQFAPVSTPVVVPTEPETSSWEPDAEDPSRKAWEEAERRAESERRAREEAERQAREAERRAQEAEARAASERKAREAEERAAAERRAREEAERKAKEAEARAEAERKAREEAKRKTSVAARTSNGWSAEHKAGTRQTLQIKGVEYAFRYCPPGTFLMGSPEDEEGRFDDETQHRVTLTNGFWMLETPVTQAMWKSVMGSNPSWFSSSGVCSSDVRGMDTSNFPVETVSWHDCQDFIKKLNSQGLALDGFKFRLPSEAEWEYACRAGTTTSYFWGDSLNGDKANCNGNYPYGTSTTGNYLRRTTEVGSYAANPWGLYDMHGNVWEWCEDLYDDYKNIKSFQNPINVTKGSHRVLRGGSWNSSAKNCRSAKRDYDDPTYRHDSDGFRLALVRSSSSR